MKQHAVEKSVFGVNFQDVSELVDALQRAIVVVYGALRCKLYGIVAETVQNWNRHALREVALLKEQRWRKKVVKLVSNFPFEVLALANASSLEGLTRTMTSDLPWAVRVMRAVSTPRKPASR